MDRKAKNKYKREWQAAYRAVAGAIDVETCDKQQNESLAAVHEVAAPLPKKSTCGHARDVTEECTTYPDTSQETESWFNDSDYCESYDSCSHSDNGNISDSMLADFLSSWVSQFGVRHNAVDKLLTILQKAGHNLPTTARTLLKTVKEVPVSDKSGMQYTYLDIEKQLKKCVKQMRLLSVPVTELELSLNVDGLPLFKSSNTCCWPVLCAIVNVQPVRVFPVAIACGKTKPRDLEFLQDTIDGLKNLLRNGLTVNNCSVVVKLRCVVCDAPARAMVKAVKLYSGYAGCDKCTQNGKWIGRITFPEIEGIQLRTDASFRARSQSAHHHEISPFCDLPVDMVKQFPIDYMHQVLLGVMRKMLVSWVRGKPEVKMSAGHVKVISERLISLRPYIPKVFVRKPRSLLELDRWKATELRLFLLYVGKFVLKGILREELYDNFVTLNVAMSLLISPSLAAKHHEYAHRLLQYFVAQCQKIYGAEFLVYNVHSLLHMAAEAEHYGSLDSCSGFLFENYLQKLKKLVRSGRNPLQQMVKRLSELPAADRLQQLSTELQISAATPNNAYILDNSACCEVLSAFAEVDLNKSSDNTRNTFLCRIYAKTQPLFTVPCDSRVIGTYVVHSADASVAHVERSMLKTRAVMTEMEKKSQYCFMAVLHAL